MKCRTSFCCAAALCVGVGLTVSLCRAAQTPTDIPSLKSLFQTDPGTAFVQAGKMFMKPMRKHDLNGMMEIIRVVAPEARRCLYDRVLDDMIDAAVPVALQTGQWQTVGDLYNERYETCGAMQCFGTSWPCGYSNRQAYAGILARQAYERTGKVPTSLQDIRIEPWPFQQWHKSKGEDWQQSGGSNPAWVQKDLPDYAEALFAIDKAQAEARDRDAIAYTAKFLQLLAQRSDPSKDGDKMDTALGCVSQIVRLRGGDQLINALCAVWPPDQAVTRWNLERFSTSLTLGWSGRNDAYRDGYYRIWKVLDPKRSNREAIPVNFIVKADRFNRRSEAISLQQTTLNYLSRAPMERRGGDGIFPPSNIVTPYTPVYLKKAFMDEWSRLTVLAAPGVAAKYKGMPPQLTGLRDCFWQLVNIAPSDQKKAWQMEAGNRMLNVAAQIPDAKARSWGATEAAKFFEQAGRKDLAEQSRTLAVSLAAGDSNALLYCAFSAAQTAANDRKWQSVESWLKPLVNQKWSEANATLLDATFLLEQAERRLGKWSDADACLSTARNLIGMNGLNSSEKTNYLMNLAGLTRDPAQKKSLMETASQAAGKAGDTFMQRSITDQLREQALSSSDLETQKKALLDIVNQQEAQRDRLAFDPLVRQQWFTQNLNTYRRLLLVSAQSGDASLALWCAERMRARALMDQLAWRKVDMAVRLPASLKKRFEDLRGKRQEAYALLRQVSGIDAGEEESSVSGDDSRGAYMPIRGAYMPVRGAYMPVRGMRDPNRRANDMDAVQLRKLLDDLAKEETALESVIREQVPAYRLATTVNMPSAAQIMQGIPQDMGILEYTLTDEGIVAVAIGPGRNARVKILDVRPDLLSDAVSELRQLIQTQDEKLGVRSQEWYESLIEPFEYQLRGSRQLMVVADGILQLMPFSALKDSRGQYLIEKYPIVYAPSLCVALSSRGDTGRQKAPRDALIVAAPQLMKSQGGSTGDQGRGAYIPIRGAYMPVRGAYIPVRGEDGLSRQLLAMASIPLPGAKAEGEMVAKRFSGATLLTGAEATKESLEQDAGKCRVLHLATHGYADPEVPEFSGLLFAGTGERDFDVLTAQEVYLWQLNAQLVTLSACETGLGKAVEGEGLMGLTRAFLYAGARDVLCSLWQVSDESTAQLMEKFYDQWQANNNNTAWSLQTAQLTLLNQEKTKHPFHWAAFVAVQGPR